MPTARQFAYGIGFLGVSVAVLIAVLAAILAAAATCACTSPADLVVVNQAHEDVTVTWQGAGLLGTPILGISSAATASACATFAQTLRPGPVDVSIRSGNLTRSASVTVPDGDARYDGYAATFVIEPDGRITGPLYGSPARGYPQDPLCR